MEKYGFANVEVGACGRRNLLAETHETVPVDRRLPSSTTDFRSAAVARRFPGQFLCRFFGKGLRSRATISVLRQVVQRGRR